MINTILNENGGQKVMDQNLWWVSWLSTIGKLPFIYWVEMENWVTSIAYLEFIIWFLDIA